MFSNLASKIPGGDPKAALMEAGKNAAIEQAQNQASEAFGDNEFAGNLASNAIGAAAGQEQEGEDGGEGGDGETAGAPQIPGMPDPNAIAGAAAGGAMKGFMGKIGFGGKKDAAMPGMPQIPGAP